MPALTQDTPRKINPIRSGWLPVATNVNIFLGAALSFAAAGFARPATAGVGEKFAGFAMLNGVNNNPGANGAVQVQVAFEGVIELPVASVVQGSLGARVYASDDGTFTLSSAGNAVPIGWVEGLTPTAGVAFVYFRGITEAAA